MRKSFRSRKAEQINFSVHQPRVIVFFSQDTLTNTRARRWVLSSNIIKIASFLPHRAVVAASHVALNTSRIQRVKCDLAKIIINWSIYSGFDWKITHGFNRSTCSCLAYNKRWQTCTCTSFRIGRECVRARSVSISFFYICTMAFVLKMCVWFRFCSGFLLAASKLCTLAFASPMRTCDRNPRSLVSCQIEQ